MKRNCLFLPLILLFAITVSCKQKAPAKMDKNLFQGAWNFDKHLSFDDLKKMPGFGEDLSDADMTVKGTHSFNSNSRYTSKGNLVLKLKSAGSNEEVAMQFEFRETGTWKMADSVLTMVKEDGDVAAADETTKQITTEDPSLLNEIKPVKGESNVLEIKSATATKIELLDTKTKLPLELIKAN